MAAFTCIILVSLYMVRDNVKKEVSSDILNAADNVIVRGRRGDFSPEGRH